MTAYFWVIKVLSTTVGESAADFLNVNLNLGLTGTSLVTGALLVVALLAQLRADRYRPGRYWPSVVLVSVFGTLVTDNLTDQVGVPLEASTLAFAALLALVFAAWFWAERTLSIHTIVTRRRECFYWLAVLVTFALGTAAGDLMAEVLGLGYLITGAIVATLIAMTALGWRRGLDPVLAFWTAYILTRPLGASLGDYLSQSAAEGGLGLGATATSLVFLAGIIGLVSYLALSKADVLPAAPPTDTAEGSSTRALTQTMVLVAVLVVVSGTGYAWRVATLAESAAPHVTAAAATPDGAPRGEAPATESSVLGDLSGFRSITQDTLRRLEWGDQTGATSRITDLETEWDNAEARLKPRDRATWTTIDDANDATLRALRSTSPDPTKERAALIALITTLQ